MSAHELSRPLAAQLIASADSGMSATTIAVVVDVDNLQNRGKGNNRAVLDVLGFGRALRARGVTVGEVFQNYPFPVVSDKVWRTLGFVPVSTGENADRHVGQAATRYVEAGSRHIVLVSSDGDFTHLVEVMRARGVRVDVMGLRGQTAITLKQAASTVEYVDKWLTEPPEALPQFYLRCVANKYDHQRIGRVGRRPHRKSPPGATPVGRHD